MCLDQSTSLHVLSVAYILIQPFFHLTLNNYIFVSKSRNAMDYAMVQEPIVWSLTVTITSG